MKNGNRLPSWWPLPAVFAWFAFTLGARTLAVPDEGRYAGVAWRMLTSGDWLVPRLDGLPYFHKPPLFYWITAAAMRLAGPAEWTARVAPLLGAMAGASALYVFLRHWRGERMARLALLVLATEVLVFVGAQFANLDMLVAGCITVTVLALAHAALRLEQGARPRAALAAAYVFAALGMLAKGLIGMVLPGLVIVAWLLLRGRWRTALRLAWWPGLLLFLAVAGPWFVLMQRAFGDFTWYFFYVQQFARYTQGGFNNGQPVVFYPVVLLALAFPWSLWIFRSLRRDGDASASDRALRVLAWTWLLAVTVFFSLPRSKLVGYIFPAGFPLALLAADAFARGSPVSPRLQAWWRASAGVAAAVCLGTIVFATARPFHSTRAIGVALRAAQPGDGVVFLKHYWFDVPVYARLRDPVVVLDDWSAANTRTHDDWRKELADAARFDPRTGAAVLRPLGDASQVLCSAGRTWVVGAAHEVDAFPLLATAPVFAKQGDVRLWRIDAADEGCPIPPSSQLAAQP